MFMIMGISSIAQLNSRLCSHFAQCKRNSSAGPCDVHSDRRQFTRNFLYRNMLVCFPRINASSSWLIIFWRNIKIQMNRMGKKNKNSHGFLSKCFFYSSLQGEMMQQGDWHLHSGFKSNASFLLRLFHCWFSWPSVVLCLFIIIIITVEIKEERGSICRG